MSDDEFTPKLGRAGRSARKDAKRLGRYGNRVLVAARLAGAKTGTRQRRFDGSRIGRGASIARLLSSRDRLGGLRGRRAIVKTRLVRLGANGLANARAHLRYIQRDGVTRDGAPGQLYAAREPVIEDQGSTDLGKAFLERGSEDRHQFRFIVSAEDGAEYADLRPYVRRLMSQMETDLGTRLDWVAVDHFNTERPHTHIMLRGVDDKGENLVIAREYVSHGLRERAAELVTLDLGPRTTREIEERLRHDVGQERLTVIDRRLLRDMDADRIVAATGRDPFRQSLASGRLRKLAEMGLADEIGAGRYQLVYNLEETLRRMGERGDIVRTMQRELTRLRLKRAGVDRVIADADTPPIVGRVLHRGVADEHRDRHYLMIDGIDGRVHYVGIGRGDATEPLPEHAIVRVSPRVAEVRAADRAVAEIAAGNDGRYSVDLHLTNDASATDAFADTHVRRLEAMRRARVGPEREPDGSWVIGADHLERAAAYEQRLLRDRPISVETLSVVPVDKLPTLDAATWLDRELASDAPLPLRNAGFGREVRDALQARRQWLVEQHLADGDGNSVRLRRQALDVLRRRELLRVAGDLEAELGKPFVEARIGQAIEGTIGRRLDLASGRYALVENARDFTLVPWRPVLLRQLGKPASGIMRVDGVSWRLERGRAGPEVG